MDYTERLDYKVLTWLRDEVDKGRTQIATGEICYIDTCHDSYIGILIRQLRRKGVLRRASYSNEINRDLLILEIQKIEASSNKGNAFVKCSVPGLQ